MINIGRDVTLSIEALLDDPLTYKLAEAFFKEELPTLIAEYEQGNDDAANILGDFFIDSFFNDSVEVRTIYGLGGYGVFPITIYQYGSYMFYNNAPEFDPSDVFDTFEEAYFNALYYRFDGFIDAFWKENEPQLLNGINHLPETQYKLESWIATPPKYSYTPADIFSFEELLYHLPDEAVEIMYHADATACGTIVNTIVSSTEKYLPIARTFVDKEQDQREQNITDLIAWGKHVAKLYDSMQQRSAAKTGQ